MAFNFLGVDHVGVAVSDLEAASSTYQNVLGFECQGGERLETRGLEVRFFATGNSRIELIAPLHDDSEVSGFLNKRGEGIHHICLRVDDIEAAVSQIAQRGGRILGKGITRGAHDSRVAFVHPKDSHGVLIELVEPNTKEDVAK